MASISLEKSADGAGASSRLGKDSELVRFSVIVKIARSDPSRPFEKGLKHWMEGHKNPERYGDVITDVYEAVEALAKSVTGRDADLSANREKFASVLTLPEAYSKMLKEYVDFGCEYRHSPETNKPRTYPSERDTEAFIYVTGVFLRLAMQTK